MLSISQLAVISFFFWLNSLGEPRPHCWDIEITLRHSTRRVIGPQQRTLLDNTQHSQETDINTPSWIRTLNPSKQAAADPRLRPHGHWDRHSHATTLPYTCLTQAVKRSSLNNENWSTSEVTSRTSWIWRAVMTGWYVMIWLESVVINFKDETEEDHKARRQGNCFSDQVHWPKLLEYEAGMLTSLRRCSV
jgi:hypothetical protein